MARSCRGRRQGASERLRSRCAKPLSSYRAVVSSGTSALATRQTERTKGERLSRHGQPRDVLAGLDLEGLDNRHKIEHVVVLMLENRSFDHMLGYLSLRTDAGGHGRDDVDGLRLDESGQAPPEFRNTYRGVEYPIFPLQQTAFGPDDGPDHSAYGIDQQLGAGTNQGYVENFAETRPAGYPDDRLGLVMGYYTGKEL